MAQSNTIFPQSGIPDLEPSKARRSDVSNIEQIRYSSAGYISPYTLWSLCGSFEPRGRRMTVMRRYNNYTMCFLAFLLLIIGAGCSDPDKAGNPGFTPPTVVSVEPPDGSAGVCPNTIVTATFSKAMNPATINDTTFLLTTGTPPVAVGGAVTYDATSKTATFTPSSALAIPTVTYTATITTGATDTFGNALASDFVWTFTTGTTTCLSGPPTVISVTPPDLSSGICPDTVVVATFSEAMNPATINTTTFTLTSGTPPVSVTGVVTYDAPSHVATFTPNSPPGLALSTTYTATITTGAQDLFGNSLASDKIWTFTTAAVPCSSIVPIGTACSFGILGATPVVSSVGPTIVTGDVGIWPAASITGVPPGTLTGTKHAANAVAMAAQGDLTTAYNFAAAAAGGAVLTADIGGQTLAPGVYKTTSAQPTLGITGNLTLSGPASGVWIFQIISTLTTAAGNSHVIMSGGGNSH